MNASNELKLDAAGIVEEIKRFMQETGLRNNEIAIGFGGAMVLLGLRDFTNDVVLDIPAARFTKFKHAGVAVKTTPMGTCMDYDTVISLHPGVPKDCQKILGVNVYSLERMLSTKMKLVTSPHRKPAKIPQDLKDIQRLKKMIEEVV